MEAKKQKRSLFLGTEPTFMSRTAKTKLFISSLVFSYCKTHPNHLSDTSSTNYCACLMIEPSSKCAWTKLELTKILTKPTCTVLGLCWFAGIPLYSLYLTCVDIFWILIFAGPFLEGILVTEMVEFRQGKRVQGYDWLPFEPSSWG